MKIRKNLNKNRNVVVRFFFILRLRNFFKQEGSNIKEQEHFACTGMVLKVGNNAKIEKEKRIKF